MKQQLMKCDDVEAMAKLYEEARIEFVKLDSGENNPMYRHLRDKIGRMSCPWVVGRV